MYVFYNLTDEDMMYGDEAAELVKELPISTDSSFGVLYIGYS